MSKLLRGLAAGYGAKKLGGGCFSTVLIFLVLWWLLGHFGVFRWARARSASFRTAVPVVAVASWTARPGVTTFAPYAHLKFASLVVDHGHIGVGAFLSLRRRLGSMVQS